MTQEQRENHDAIAAVSERSSLITSRLRSEPLTIAKEKTQHIRELIFQDRQFIVELYTTVFGLAPLVMYPKSHLIGLIIAKRWR